MTDRPSYPEEDAAVPNVEPGTGMPRWVKISLIVVGVLVVGAIALRFLGGHGSGPGMDHGAGMGTPSSSAISGQASSGFQDLTDDGGVR